MLKEYTETKAAFGEGTIRSLKNIFYFYMEVYGYKYLHKTSQFVATLISRKNYSMDLIPKNVKNSDFFSHFEQQATARTQKTQV